MEKFENIIFNEKKTNLDLKNQKHISRAENFEN